MGEGPFCKRAFSPKGARKHVRIPRRRFSAGEGNLLRKISLPRAPTLLKLLGKSWRAYEGERLQDECGRSPIFQQSLPLRFWGKGVWGRGPFCKRALSPKGTQKYRVFCGGGKPFAKGFPLPGPHLSKTFRKKDGERIKRTAVKRMQSFPIFCNLQNAAACTARFARRGVLPLCGKTAGRGGRERLPPFVIKVAESLLSAKSPRRNP